MIFEQVLNFFTISVSALWILLDAVLYLDKTMSPRKKWIVVTVGTAIAVLAWVGDYRSTAQIDGLIDGYHNLQSEYQHMQSELDGVRSENRQLHSQVGQVDSEVISLHSTLTQSIQRIVTLVRNCPLNIRTSVNDIVKTVDSAVAKVTISMSASDSAKATDSGSAVISKPPPSH